MPQAINPTKSPDECTHEKCTPKWDEVDAQTLSSDEVREKYPRFSGTCPDCGWYGIIYASQMQYIMGDY